MAVLKVTDKLLADKLACWEFADKFRKKWPDGTELNEELVTWARRYGVIDWGINNIIPAAANRRAVNALVETFNLDPNLLSYLHSYTPGFVLRQIIQSARYPGKRRIPAKPLWDTILKAWRNE